MNKNSKTTPQRLESHSHEFLGHPMGLWVLFTTEMWERFCYYGMRAFLVMYLYFSVSGKNPGFGWSEKEAYELYGWFTGLVYLFPLFGGFIADRFIGQHRSVLYGGILIAIGELCLFFTEYFRMAATSPVYLDSYPLAYLMFMLGLVLITVGTGFFKPCISVMVGGLYKKDDSRRDVAFTIFYMGINVGAFLAPFVAGTIAERIGWHWGFLTAALGMIFGLCTYSFFRPKYLGHIGLIPPKKADPSSLTEEQLEEKKIHDFEQNRPLGREDIDRIAVILILSFFCIAFWSVFEQAGSSLNTFAKKETNRQINLKIGRNIFLANEDETDALLAFENVRTNIVKAEASLNGIDLQIEEAKKLLMNEGKNNPELIKRVTVYDESSKSVQYSIENAVWAIKKAEEARKNAGLEPLGLTIPSMSVLLAEGKREIEEIDALAEERLKEKFPTEFENIPEEKKAELIVQRDNLKKGFVQDIIMEREKAFAKEREDNLDAEKTIYTFPATWYQSVNPLGIVLFAPLFAGLWVFLGKRNLEPSTPIKFGIGLIVLSIAYMFMIAGAIQSQKTGGNAAAYWLLATYVFCTLGELCLSPVGLSMVSRLAPARYASLLMGIWFLSSAVAGYLSGKLAAVLGSSEAGGSGRVAFFFGSENGMADYFLIMTLAPLVAGLLVFMLAPTLKKMMH
ncbi:MAG: oligopeptide:H+ symporter [Planctomycetia bacterium]|nr:oligopeptide:H+ symporter [Planctomycetia bacterium]